MNSVILFTITFLLIVLSYFSFFYVLEGIREFRKLKKKSLCFFFIWLFISIISIKISINDNNDILFLETAAIFLGVVLNYIILQIELKNLFSLSLYSFSIINLIANIFSNISFIINKFQEYQYAPLLYTCIIILIWVFYMLIGKKIRNDSFILPSHIMLIVGLSYIIVNLLLSFITFISKRGILGDFSKTISIMNAIVTIIVLAISLFLIYYYNGKKGAEFETKYAELFNKQQKEYYELLIKKENDTRQYRHDIIAQLIHIEQSLSSKQYERAECFLKDMLNEISYINKSDYDVGNYTVNMMLNFYLVPLQRAGISIEVKGFMPQEIIVSDRDLCIVISNLLKNAKEAVESITSNARFISVTINSGNIFWNFNVANSTNNTKFVTTNKSDSINHGYGISNIINCVNKYKGTYSFNIHDDTFIAEVKMPIK